MASPRCPQSAPRRLESTTTKFSGSSGLARPKSMVCVRAVLFQKQRNMRPSTTTYWGGEGDAPKPRVIATTWLFGLGGLDDKATSLSDKTALRDEAVPRHIRQVGSARD